MKLVLTRTNLKEGLSVIERAGGENLTLPILRNVLVEAEENKIKLTATNLEIAVCYVVPGKIIEDGKITVPIRILSDLVSNLQTERLNLEKKGSGLEIKSDNYHAVLQGLPFEDFPLIPKIKNLKEYIELDAHTLKEAIQQVVVATQPSELRPELNSVLFNFSLDNLQLAATDSFRLAERTIPGSQFEAHFGEKFKVLVPLKTSQELLRVLKDGERVRLYHDHNQVLLTSSQLELISRLIEGTFPDYETIVPKKFDAELTLERQEFMNALKIASVLGLRTNEVKIKVHVNKKAVEVTSADQTVGENTYLIPAKIAGTLGDIVFNWRYLLDALKVLTTNEVFFGVNENSEPSLIRSPHEGSYFYILKPILKT